jgi:aspartate 1-decarboxylase
VNLKLYGKIMYREVCRAKIHRATITEADLNYEGSLTLDPVLMEAADIRTYEKVQVVNVNNGSRIETYVIKGVRGSGQVILNGPAARHGQPGDLVVIITYGLVEDSEEIPQPKLIMVDEKNRPR